MAKRYTYDPTTQEGAALLAYALCRGHLWADSTSIGEALELLQHVSRTEHPLGEPEESPVYAACLRYLELRARQQWEGYSVADCSRVAWYRRRVASWEDSFRAPWPGGKAWQELRLRHLVEAGWTAGELSALFDIPKRTIGGRLSSLGDSKGAGPVCSSCGTKMHPLAASPNGLFADASEIVCLFCLVATYPDEKRETRG